MRWQQILPFWESILHFGVFRDCKKHLSPGVPTASQSAFLYQRSQPVIPVRRVFAVLLLLQDEHSTIVSADHQRTVPELRWVQHPNGIRRFSLCTAAVFIAPFLTTLARRCFAQRQIQGCQIPPLDKGIIVDTFKQRVESEGL